MSRRRQFLVSTWLAVTVGLLLVAALIFVLRAPSSGYTKVVIGARDEVYYSQFSSEAEARALGQALRNTGFLNDRGTRVMLSKTKAGTVVSFVLDDGASEHPGAADNFAEIGRRIATSVGGFPIKVHLVDAARSVRRELIVGKATIGSRDAVYYFGSATEAEAKSLGRALQAAGYFQDAGVSVVLTKGEGTVVSFVINEGIWDQTQAVAELENLVRRIAPSVGGLPIKLRLLNSNRETRKEVLVQ